MEKRKETGREKEGIGREDMKLNWPHPLKLDTPTKNDHTQSYTCGPSHRVL